MMNHGDRIGFTEMFKAEVRWPREWRILLLLMVPIALAYASALGNGFVYDDHHQIARNPGIRSLQQAMAYVVQPIAYGSITQEVSQYHYRPFFWLSLALDYTLWGPHPFGYHLTNILLHLVNTGLLYLLLLRLFATRPVAFATSLLWGLHPIHTEAVTWISGRPAALSTSFALLALLLFFTAQEQEGRQKGAAASGSCACTVLALLTHEMAVSLPAIALLLDWARSRRAGRTWRPSQFHLLLWGALAAYALLRFTLVPMGASTSTWAGFTHQIEGRLLRIPSLLQTYLTLLAFPLRLSLDHSPEIPNPTSPWQSAVWGPALLLIALLLSAWRMRRRSWLPLLGLAWFALSIAPVSNLAPIYKIIAERFLYFPSIGLMLAVVGGGQVALETATQWSPRFQWRKAAITCLALLVFGYGLRVALRNRDWRDDLTLFQATVAVSPQSFLAHRNLGGAYILSRQYGQAEQSYRQAIALKPDFAQAFFGLGIAYLQQRRSEEAIAAFQRAVELSPRDAGFHETLGKAYLMAGNVAAAIAELQSGITLGLANAEAADAYHNLGLAYQQMGKPDLALAALQKARLLRSNDEAARHHD